MAVSSYDKNKLSQANQNAITRVTQKAQNGEISWADAHSQAESIRNSAGYSGGQYGNAYTEYKAPSSGNNSNNGSNPYSGTNYHQAAINAAQNGDYMGMIDALNDRYNKVTAQGGNDRGNSNYKILSELMAQYFPNGNTQVTQVTQVPQFSSSVSGDMQGIVDTLLNGSLDDFKQSDQYDALKKQYANSGELSMNDLMGQVSARTGGLASSYAAQASNQTYNDWMENLEQAAQSMYQQDRSDKVQNLSALQGQYDNQYSQYQDQLSQYNTDRNYNQQAQQDAIANQYQKDQWNYGMSQDEWSKTASQAETLAQYGNFSGYKALGYTDSQIAAMKKQWQTEQAQKAAKKSSAGTGGGSQNYDGLFASAHNAVSPQNFISSNYKKYGFSSASGLWSAYQKWANNGSDATSLNFDEDSGIFNWNGKQFSKIDDLSSAIEKAGLTSSQKQALTKKFAMYGFNIIFS